MDEQVRTYGEWLAKRYERGEVVRLRSGSDAFGDDGYAFYPERSLLEEEFRAIWKAQSAHYPDLLTEERRAHLFKVIFYQRPLKKPRIGKCSFNTKEERLPKAHPLFQEFRLYKEVNELELVQPDLSAKKLTRDQRDALIHHLRNKRKVAFTSLRKTLKLAPDTTFNKASESRKDLLGDEVYSILSDKKRFGARWGTFSREEQWQIVQKLKK